MTDERTATATLLRSLEYPFDPSVILQKKVALKKQLLNDQEPRLRKNIAILGGSTTNEITNILELFLLKLGIEPTFYESEYGKYYEDVMFNQETLKAFRPDIVYFHTTFRNLTNLPTPASTEEEVAASIDSTLNHFTALWQTTEQVLRCPVIQNNFELPNVRPLANLDCSSPIGRTSYVMRLNAELARFADRHSWLLINDICYLSAQLGLDRWYDDRLWHAYKYALSYQCVPHLAYRIAQLIGAVFGFSKKCLIVDLDDTLWGGIIGDAGLSGIHLGNDTPEGAAYAALQVYLRELGQRGVILAVCSKNDERNALAGFTHPDTVLKLDDFAAFRANWEMKSTNILAIAHTLNIGSDSFVFLDDNPVERELIRSQLPLVTVPELGRGPHTLLRILDQAALFESVSLSEDDRRRNRQYAEERSRKQARSQFQSYGEFLASLEMEATIGSFEPIYFDRITQLINKTNQFNLTTKRRTASEVAALAEDPNCITLYGRLKDKFGDNGLITVLIGRCDADSVHIDTWLMSCRVFNRGMEAAVFNALVDMARGRNIMRLLGYYYPTKKNALVSQLYPAFGFRLLSTSEAKRTTWVFDIPEHCDPRPHSIRVNKT